MKITPPSAAHKAFRDALVETMRKHVGDLSAAELLAVASHLVGQIVAMQDQRSMTSAMAMELVSKNIQQGNLDALQELLGTTGGTA